MQEIIEIDGSLYQGGGQMIRSSLALSIILHKEFRIHSIRKNRPNPGINNQLRSVFAAFTPKAPKVGDTEVYFYPNFLNPTSIKANTAASCTLMLQCFLPICAGLRYQTQIKLQGGTDVSRSPSLESVCLGLIPLLKRMGVKLQLGQIKKGYYPVGRGYFTFTVSLEQQTIKPIKLTKLSPPTNIVITYYVKDKKPPGSSKEFMKEIKQLCMQTFGNNHQIQIEVKAQKVFNTKDQYGIGCMIIGDGMVWDVGTVGQPVKEQTIIQRLHHYCQIKCCLDQHHQDQLLLVMALADGRSELLIGQQLSLHTKSLLYVIKQFIPELKYEHQDSILSIEGIGFKCGK